MQLLGATPVTTTTSTTTSAPTTTTTLSPTTTTTEAPTTTTTTALVAYPFTLASLSSTNPSFACSNGFGGGTETVYASTNNGASVSAFFADVALTTPFVGDSNAYLFMFDYPSGTGFAAYIDASGVVSGNTAC